MSKKNLEQDFEEWYTKTAKPIHAKDGNPIIFVTGSENDLKIARERLQPKYPDVTFCTVADFEQKYQLY